MHPTSTHPALAALAPALLLALGCASAPTPTPYAVPPSVAPPSAAPPLAAAADPAPRKGPLVHITNADPSKPLALYSYEPTVGVRQVTAAPMEDPVGGRRESFTEAVVVDTGLERVLCLAPCDREVVVPFTHELFLGGEGIPPSIRFRLGPGLGRVEIEAAPGSMDRTRGGRVLVTLGTIGAVVGTVLLPNYAAAHDREGTVVSGGLLGVGGALLAAGIPLMITGGTKYTLRRPDVALRF